MIIVTVDGKRWAVKYMQNKEDITNDFGSTVFQYPNFNGSKVHQNSTSSDKYSLSFAIHKNFFVGFKESIKKFVINEEDAIEDQEYGKLTNIVIVHDTWGAIKGKFVGNIKYNTSSDGDIICNTVFVEHTEDNDTEKKDIEQENQDAASEVDTETSEGEFEEEDRPALLKFLDWLNALYSNIKNSAIVAAFNDLKSALNEALLNFQKIMNAVKKILALPLALFDAVGDIKRKFDLIKKQAMVIKNMPKTSFNLAKFNVQCLAYNTRVSSRVPFINPAALKAAAGIKTVPL